MRKILKAVFSQAFIGGFLLLLQLFLIGASILRINEYFLYFDHLLKIISLVVVVFPLVPVIAIIGIIPLLSKLETISKTFLL